MNLKKSSLLMLGLVFGVSAILYIADIPKNNVQKVITPTITVLPSTVPTLTATPVPSTQIVQSPPPTNPTATPVLIVPTVVSTIKHLSATVDYSVRRFPESITVNMTLDGTVVSDLQLSQTAGSGESAAYQDAFASEIKSYVVGKNIKDISVSRVAGASYTTTAFMQALQNIQSKI